MTSRWRLRDYVFAAFMTIGMIVSGFVVAPFVPPGFQLFAWAPIAAIFITLGMARLQRVGALALMTVPFAILMAPFHWAMTLYLGATIVLTEGIMWLRGSYRRKVNRLLGNALFFGLAALLGLPTLAFIVRGRVGERLAEVLMQMPWMLILSTLLCALAGVLGWWLGEQVIRQLQRAGKLDVDL
jgi:energy-coupling factor transport system substrate-specific component